jgi:hypothetical protein
MIKCPWCGTEVSTEEYSRHYETCPKRKERWERVTPEVTPGERPFSEDILRIARTLAANPFASNTPEWRRWRREILRKLAEEQG